MSLQTSHFALLGALAFMALMTTTHSARAATPISDGRCSQFRMTSPFRWSEAEHEAYAADCRDTETALFEKRRKEAAGLLWIHRCSNDTNLKESQVEACQHLSDIRWTGEILPHGPAHPELVRQK